MMLVSILVAMAAALTFVVAYPVRVPPRYWTREGWHMWLFTLALVSLGGSSLTRRVWADVADTLLYVAVIQVTYATLAALMCHRVFLLFTAQRHDRILHEKDR